MKLSRRHWMVTTAASTLGVCCAASDNETRASYFQTRRIGQRWLLASPEGEPFFSIGLNHLDPATLRYPDNVVIWHDKYGGSMQRGLRDEREEPDEPAIAAISQANRQTAAWAEQCQL